MDRDNTISRDALAIAQNLIDLTRELAITNQNLSQVGSEVTSHNKILYGDDQGRGGLLVRMATAEDVTTQHKELLNQLEASCGEVVKSLNTQLIISKQQGESIGRLYKMMFILMGTVLFVIVALGLAGWKEVASILTALGL